VREAGLGITLTALVTGLVWFLWGWVAVPGALVFGLLATGIHVVAIGLLRPALVQPFDRLLKRWFWGTLLRGAGVFVLAAALFVFRGTIPALPTALGFLGVLIPLLFSEMRLLIVTLRTGR
jgi:hypothetical protein